MERVLNVQEVLIILEEYYITSSIQIITKWIREGKIKAERSENRKVGWSIKESDLFSFIEEKRPGLAHIYAVYREFIKHKAEDEQKVIKPQALDENQLTKFEQIGEQLDVLKIRMEKSENKNEQSIKSLMETVKMNEGSIKQLIKEFDLSREASLENRIRNIETKIEEISKEIKNVERVEAEGLIDKKIPQEELKETGINFVLVNK